MNLSILSIADLVALREYLKSKVNSYNPLPFVIKENGDVEGFDASGTIPKPKDYETIKAIEEEIERRIR